MYTFVADAALMKLERRSSRSPLITRTMNGRALRAESTSLESGGISINKELNLREIFVVTVTVRRTARCNRRL